MVGRGPCMCVCIYIGGEGWVGGRRCVMGHSALQGRAGQTSSLPPHLWLARVLRNVA